MDRSSSRGFSLIELGVVIIVMGLVLAFGIPLFSRYSSTQQLKGAAENIAAQMRLLRETAIGTATSQTMHFVYRWVFNGQTSDYHVHNGTVVGAVFSLPRGIAYYPSGYSGNYTAKTDGRFTSGGLIIVVDPNGLRDTVSVMASGLILTK